MVNISTNNTYKLNTKILKGLKHIITLTIVFISLFPVYWLVTMSFRSMEEMKGKISIIPGSFTFEHFISLFKVHDFGRTLFNSFEVASISSLFSLLIGLCCAYVLGRNRFRFKIKKSLSFWLFLVRILPPIAFAIPLYIMFVKANVLNSKIPIYLACILINLTLIVWYMISFFSGIPEELEEAAKIDGAKEGQIFRKVILPLVSPGISAITMLSFMYAWNEYTYSIIFIQSPKNYTIPLALSVLNTEDNLTNFGLVAAGGVISMVPLLIFVIFAQKYLISGLSSGAVKD